LLCFWIGSSICPGLASARDPPTYTSFLAGITGVYHQAWLVYWDGILLYFYSCWPCSAPLK
jgi:hypothetical protein